MVYLVLAADFDHQSRAFIFLKHAIRHAHMAHINIEPQARPAVAPEHAVLEQATVGFGHLDAAGVPAAIDRLPAVTLPETLLIDKPIAACRAAGLPAAAHEAAEEGSPDSHAGSGHVFHDAVFHQIVRPVQRDDGALGETGAVAEDKTAHLNIGNAFFTFP